MRDRLVTLLGALAALAIVYGLFLKRPGEPPVTRPVSDEAGRNGYLALRNWLEQADIPVVSLRERFPKLRDDAGFGGGGNILVTTMPYYTPLRASEIEPLEGWVEAGNTLLILAALDDTPEWSPVTLVSSFRTDLGRLTGLSYTTLREEALAARAGASGAAGAPRPGRTQIEADTEVELEAIGGHPLLANVAKLRGYSDQPSDLMRVRGLDPYRLVLRLATESSSGLDALWQLPRGRGQIIVSASGSLLVNRNIVSEDARQFVRNLVRYHLGAGGSVIFDDMHQGVSALYDPAAFFRDARLSYTLWFVAAAWLAYILGSSNRLAPPLAPRTAPRQGDFLAAAGGFMARRLDRRAAGLLLIEEWLDEMRRVRGLRRGTPIWSELEEAPTLAREIFKELHGYHRQLADGGKVSLVRLHNVLKRAREAVG